MFLSYDQLKKKVDAYVLMVEAEWAQPSPDITKIQALNATMGSVFEIQRECRMYDATLLATQKEHRIATEKELKREEAERRKSSKRYKIKSED